MPATTTGTDAIAAAFAAGAGRAALMPYLMGGFPDAESSLAAAHACVDAGADLIELGVPFSDPLADGPVIHDAATRALAAGIRPHDVLDICREVGPRAPVLLMAYANTVLSHGGGGFIRDAAGAGAAGIIVPDLPHDEAAPIRDGCDAAGLALVPLVAPTTTSERIAAIGADARGFVYVVSVRGTTGERAALPEGLEQTIGLVRAGTDLPVAVGFGVSTADHARRVATLADGVIVGTRVGRAMDEGGSEAVREVVAELAAALGEPRG